MLSPGRRASVTHEVRAEDTAQAVGSGDVAVLATPRVLALLEAATVRGIADALEPGQTSVGVRVELAHRAPTAVGRTVRADAELVQVDGRRLVFETTLHDGDVVAATARIERVVVDRERFAR